MSVLRYGCVPESDLDATVNAPMGWFLCLSPAVFSSPSLPRERKWLSLYLIKQFGTKASLHLLCLQRDALCVDGDMSTYDTRTPRLPPFA